MNKWKKTQKKEKKTKAEKTRRKEFHIFSSFFGICLGGIFFGLDSSVGVLELTTNLPADLEGPIPLSTPGIPEPEAALPNLRHRVQIFGIPEKEPQTVLTCIINDTLDEHSFCGGICVWVGYGGLKGHFWKSWEATRTSCHCIRRTLEEDHNYPAINFQRG